MNTILIDVIIKEAQRNLKIKNQLQPLRTEINNFEKNNLKIEKLIITFLTITFLITIKILTL